MRWLSAGVTYVNFAVVASILLGTLSGGLHRWNAVVSLLVGLTAACFAYLSTHDRITDQNIEPEPQASLRSKRKAKAARRPFSLSRYSSFWCWAMVFCFAAFALRSFCWLFYIDGNEFKIQSPNNLGDLGLHLTYINYFANGAPIWPDNPIYPIGKLRYPAGIDIFNALLTLAGIDLRQGLVWVGLLGAAATCYLLYRWAGSFGIAGFLFNGGLAGSTFLRTHSFLDYQGDKAIAWKSLALSMLVTQRGLLYALPAGLFLLCYWRQQFFGDQKADQEVRPLLPRWVAIATYATMPLFHAHTFIALSIVLLFIFAFGGAKARRESLIIVGAALLPATLCVWETTDHFGAGSMLKWKPGWVQQPPGEMARPFLEFWFLNFGLWVPLVLILLILVGWRVWKARSIANLPAAAVFLAAATFIFVFACLVKTAPWEWDNIKLILWAYLIMLPFLWAEMIRQAPVVVRVAACIVLFFSGFVTLIGGLAAGKTGYGIADRAEVAMTANALRKLPMTARVAGYATYNHPVLVSGHAMVLGYPGHLWTQGVDYTMQINKLGELMNGKGDWRRSAQSLGARYLFWGREEKANYPTSTRPWERDMKPIANGSWGALYDLQSANTSPIAPQR